MKRAGLLAIVALAFAGVSFGQLDKKQEPRMRKDHKAPQKIVMHDSKKLKNCSQTGFAAHKIEDFRHRRGQDHKPRVWRENNVEHTDHREFQQ